MLPGQHTIRLLPACLATLCAVATARAGGAAPPAAAHLLRHPLPLDPWGIISNPQLHGHCRVLAGGVVAAILIVAILGAALMKFRRLNRRLIREIGERTVAEEALREKERFLQTVIDSEPDCVHILDRRGTVLYMNQAGLAMLGLESLEQIRGNALISLVPDGYRDDFASMLTETFRGNDGYLHLEISGHGGRRLWLDCHTVPLPNNQGEITSLLGITRDVTQQKRAELALQENEKNLLAILDGMPVGIALTDGTTILYLNDHFVERFGYGRREIRTDQEWFLNAYPDAEYRETLIGRWRDALQRARQTGEPVPQMEVRVTCKDGSVLDTIACTKLIQDRILIIFTDITERELLHNQMLKIEKLESLGLLAGGIAHDFNNILTGIMGYISFAQMLLDPDHRSREALEAATVASRRASELSRQLLTFARGGEPVKRPVSLHELVQESLSLALSGSHCAGVVQMDDSLHSVEADAGQLNQVINNLVINAEQAMPRGGVVTIAAANQTLEEANRFLLPAGEYVKVTVSDQGCGIPTEHLNRIFDPYFSTKPGGNGLGLASVHSIVRKHGGHISVHSRPGTGTTFSLLLPAGSRAVAPAGSPPERPAGNVTGGALLVMDDEATIRNLASDLLGELGYPVVTCGNGAEAISRYRSAAEEGSPFAAVIMDLTIPGGMGGREAAAQILAFDPVARLIVSSGYCNDPVMADFSRFGFRGAIHKPYEARDVARVLGSVLAGGAGTEG